MIYGDNEIVSNPANNANMAGQTYAVTFEMAPAVYQGASQATAASDRLRVSILNSANQVIASYLAAPGAFAGVPVYTPVSFNYVGDGSGPIKVKIDNQNPSSGRFAGAIDNLQISPVAIASFAETNTTLSANGSLAVSDLDTSDTVSAAISSVTLSGSFMGSGASLPATLGSNADGFAALKAMLTLSAAGNIATLSADASAESPFNWAFASGATGDASFNFLSAGETLTLTYTITLTDSSAAPSPQASPTATTTVAITITGSEDIATLTSATKALTETNAVLSTSGQLVLADLDATAATVVAQSNQAGSYGKFTIDAAGQWSYVSNDALNALNAGQVVSDVFAVATTDGGSASVTVTITGTNDGPAIGTGLWQATVIELPQDDPQANAFTHHRSGTISFMDVDLKDGHSVEIVPAAAAYRGHLVAAIAKEPNGGDGKVDWTYSVTDADLGSLDAGQVVIQSYRLILRDQAGVATEPQQVSITLIGSADVPVAARLEGRQGTALREALPTTLFAANGGNGDLSYSLEPFSMAGVTYPVPSWLSINSSTGRLSGTPGAQAIGDNIMAVVASDQAGGRTVAYLTIAIANINDPPAVTTQAKAAISVTQDSVTALDVHDWFTDADLPFFDATGAPLDGLSFAVKEADAPIGSSQAWFSIDSNTGILKLMPTNLEVGQRALQIQVADRAGVSAYATTIVTVVNVNDPPSLNSTVAAGFTLRTLPEDSPFSLVIPADLFTDPDQGINPAERIQLSVSQAGGQPLPVGWQFDSSTGVITGSTVGLLTTTLQIQATDRAGTSAPSPHLLTLAVDRQSTAPLITVVNSKPQAPEGSWLRLSDALVVRNADPDSEQLSVLLEATAGISLELVQLDSAGQPASVIPATDPGQWRLTSLDGLALRPTDPFASGSTSLKLTAYSSETLGVASGPASASSSTTLQASFIPVANAPRWPSASVGPNDPLARTPLGSSIAVFLLDQDGSEALSYRLTWPDAVTNLRVIDPSGSALGTPTSQGVLLSAAEWAKAILVQDGGNGSALDLTVVPIATETVNGDSREGDSKPMAWAATPQLSQEPVAIEPATPQINRFDGGIATSGQRGALNLDLQIPAGARTVQLEFTLPAGSSLLDGEQILAGSVGSDGRTRVLLTYDVASLSGQAKPWDHLSVVAPEGFKGLWQGSARLLSSARGINADPFSSATFAADSAGHVAVASDPIALTLAVLAQARQPSLSASYDPASQSLQISLQRGHSHGNAFDGEEALALVVRGVPDGLALVDANNRPVGASDAYGTTVLINRDPVASSLASQVETLNLFLIRRPGTPGGGTLSGSLNLALTALLPGEQQGGDSRSTPVERQLALTGATPIRELAKIDPLMVDLGGDGLALVDLAASPVRFDTLGLGLPFPTAWLQTTTQASINDAFVVVDRNGDGQITSITEMLSEYFGSSDGRRTAASGLDALARLDTNQDGRIDGSDRDWSSLKLWFDHGNGQVDPGELVPLASRLGSISLSLASPLSPLAQDQPAWAAGNQILRSTVATATNPGDPSPTLYDVGLGVALAPTVAQAASISIDPSVAMAEDSYGASLTISSTAIEAAIASQSIGADAVLVRLMGLPEAVIPTLGVKDQRGDWLFTWRELQQQANRLVLASTNNWSGSSTLQLIASQVRADGSVVGSTLATSRFTVTPVADQPLLRLQSGRVQEDGSIQLSQLVRQASLRDLDGSERLSFQLKADPAFSLWNGSRQVQESNGFYQLDQLEGWSLRPLSQFSGQLAIQLTAIASETASQDPALATAGVSLSTNLEVTAQADLPSMSLVAKPLALQEGGTLPLATLVNELNLQVSSPDTDGSEQLLLRLGHVPAGLVLETLDPSDSRRITGSRNSDGSRDLVIDAADLAFLQLRDALGSCPDQFTLEITAITRERSNGDEASAPATALQVDLLRFARPAAVQIVAPSPQLESASPSWALNQFLTVTPASPTDRLTVVLSGLCSDLILRDANGVALAPDAAGQVRLSSLAGLRLERPAHFSGSLSLGVEALSTAAWGGRQATSGQQSLTLRVLPVADAPLLLLPASAQGMRPSDSGWLNLGEIQVQLADADGSERAQLLILGLPPSLESSAFSQPAERIDYTPAGGVATQAWRVGASQLSELQIWLGDLGDDLDLTLIPRSVEQADGSSADGLVGTLTVLGGAQARVPLLSAGDLVTDEDTPVPLLASSGGVIQAQLQGNVQQQDLSYRITLQGDRAGAHLGSFVRWDSSARLWRDVSFDAPASLTLRAADWTGVAWRPSANQVGTMGLQVEAISSNRRGTSTETSAPLTLQAQVRPVNDAPQVVTSLGDRGLGFGSSVDLDLGQGFQDPDPGDQLTYQLTLSNALAQNGSWLTIRDGHLVGSPTAADAGAWDLQIQAVDGQGLAASQSLRWVVGESNQAPTVLPTAQSLIQLSQNETLNLDFASLFSDSDLGPDQRLSYTIRSADGEPAESIAWLSDALAAMGDGHQLSLPTDNSRVGSTDLIIRASDPQGLSAEHRLRLVITNVNDAPTVQRPTALAQGQGLWEERFSLTPGAPLSLDLAGLFQDPDSLFGQASPEISLRNGAGGVVPAWISWDPATGHLLAAPGTSAGGSYAIDLEAKDPQGLTAVYRLLLEVNNPPSPTSPTPLERRFQTDRGLSLPLASLFSDPDQGDQLTVVATMNRLQLQADGSWQEQGQALDAPWLTITNAASGGALTLNPNRGEAGRYRLHLQATDHLGASSSQSLDLEVVAANAAPQVTRQLGTIRSDDNSPLTLNLAELFGDLDLSQPVSSGFSASPAETLTYSYALVGGDQAWVTTTLDGQQRLAPAIQLRDSNASDVLVDDLLRLNLPGVDRTMETTLRLFATDASGSQASQDVTLTITPRLELPSLAPLTAPSVIGQAESLRIGQLLSALPQLADPEGDQLSLLIRTVPGVGLTLPAGYLGRLEPLPATTTLALADGHQVQAQGWRLQISSSDPGHDLALLPEVSLQLAADSGLLQPGTGLGTGQPAVIALPVDLGLEVSLRGATDGSVAETLPSVTGSSQLRWIPIPNQAPQFEWGAPSRFVRAEVGSQPQGLLADLTTLFIDPDLGAEGGAAGGLRWELSLPSRLQGLIDLDQATGSLRWRAGVSLGPELAGAYRLVVSAFDRHYALGDNTAMAQGVVQLFIKVPGAPPSAMEDLVTRLQRLPSVNGSRGWSLFQPTDLSLADKNMVATSELLSEAIGFLSPSQAIAALPSGLTLASSLGQVGLDPISYSLATDQPGGWYSLVDLAISEQAADGLVVMKGYDADHNTITTELAYRQYHSRFVSFDQNAQRQYGGDFARWLRDQQFSISTYESDKALVEVSESQLLDPAAAAAMVQGLPTETGLQGERIAADGSALLIDSNGDGKVDYIRLLLIDNGVFDLNPSQGQIGDPMALLPVDRQSSQPQQGGSDGLSSLSWSAKDQSGATTLSSLNPSAGAGLSTQSGEKQAPGQGPEGLVSVDLQNDDRKGEDAATDAGDGPRPTRAEKMDELLAIDVKDVVEGSKETIENAAESIKETFSKLLRNKDVVSSRFLAGLLLPAGGTSVVEQLLGKISTGSNHRLAQRDRNLRGRWRLGPGRRVLTLVDGRVRLTRQDDPIATAALEGFPAGDDPSLASLVSGRLLELVRRSPAPDQALDLIQRQLRSLLIDSVPVTWTPWLQALPAALAYGSRLQTWRARTSLKYLQQELARLGAIDPALMDVLMAAELATCLEAFELDLLTEIAPAATQLSRERGASLISP